MPVFIFLALAILFHLILKYTVYGKHTYAIGSNEAAARMSGIKVDRHKVMVYTHRRRCSPRSPPSCSRRRT